MSFYQVGNADGDRFEIHAVNLGKTVSGKIHDGLGLLKGNVAEQRLVAAVGRLHVDEEHLCKNLAERPEPQEDRPADVAGQDSLVRRLDVYGVVDRELAEARSPGVRQGEIGRARVDQDIADDSATWVRAVFDGGFDDYSTHDGCCTEVDVWKAYRLWGDRSLRLAREAKSRRRVVSMRAFDER